jgi:hypothetical protein
MFTKESTLGSQNQTYPRMRNEQDINLLVNSTGITSAQGIFCNAPSGALGSPTWTHEVTQGNSKGTGFSEDPSAQSSNEGLGIKVEV